MKPRLLSLTLLAVCLGCSDGSPFDYLKVNGTLTYEDGSPIPADSIVLQFVAQDAQPIGESYPRAAKALVDKTGKFDCATSYKYGDGLVPGRHKVAVHYATDASGKLQVPREYTNISTTPLMVDTAQIPFIIQVPKEKS